MKQAPLFAGDPEAQNRFAAGLSDADVLAWPVDAGWRDTLDEFFASPTGARLVRALRERLAAGATVFPVQPLRALEWTPLDQVRGVILGQDPYHGPGQAEGLAFSVAPDCRIPPSLRNIFKELQRDLGQARPASGSLAVWAQRGVLLLNTCLTVEQGLPNSHAGLGWESLTDALLARVATQSPACVFMLWGAHAQAKEALILRSAAVHPGRVLILKANHPSPLAASRPPNPFLGCGHFSLARDWLQARGVVLDWSLPTP